MILLFYSDCIQNLQWWLTLKTWSIKLYMKQDWSSTFLDFCFSFSISASVRIAIIIVIITCPSIRLLMGTLEGIDEGHEEECHYCWCLSLRPANYYQLSILSMNSLFHSMLYQHQSFKKFILALPIHAPDKKWGFNFYRGEMKNGGIMFARADVANAIVASVPLSREEIYSNYLKTQWFTIISVFCVVVGPVSSIYT